jgi:hypothetical protein
MGAPQLSLNEVEAYAQEHDSEVFPKAGRTHDGLHAYGPSSLWLWNWQRVSRFCETVGVYIITRTMDDCIIRAS